jgi:hypothetical protein
MFSQGHASYKGCYIAIQVELTVKDNKMTSDVEKSSEEIPSQSEITKNNY